MEQDKEIKNFLATPEDFFITHLDLHKFSDQWMNTIQAHNEKWVELVNDAMTKTTEAILSGKQSEVDGLAEKIAPSISDLLNKDAEEYTKLGATQANESYTVGFQEGAHRNTKDFAKTMLKFIDEGVLPDGTGEWRQMMEYVMGVDEQMAEEQFAGKPLTMLAPKK